MSLLGFIGSMVYHSPNFVKNWLERFVFMESYQTLPEPERHRTHGRVALVPGGCTGRPEKSAILFQAGKVDRILLSGGIGPFSQNQIIPEAELDREILIHLGVPKNAIYTETKSTTTKENMRNSLPMLENIAESYGELDVIVVTNHFHVKRSVTLLRRAIRRSKHPMATNLNVFWSSAPFRKCELLTWRSSRCGCALVGKEAVRLFQAKLGL